MRAILLLAIHFRGFLGRGSRFWVLGFRGLGIGIRVLWFRVQAFGFRGLGVLGLWPKP